MNIQLSPEESLILQILRIYFTSGDPAVLKSMDEPDWHTVYRLAYSQHILPTVFEVLQKAEGLIPDPEFYRLAKVQTISQVVSQYRQTAAYEQLLHDLQDAGFHPLTVKGPLCAVLYPKPEQRITADHDMMVSPDEFAACRAKLLELGFVPEQDEHESERGYEVSYRNTYGTLHIELHRRFFDEVDRELNGLFCDAFDDTAVLDGYLTMSPQKTLLFLILHAFKHFINSGVGIRQVCDIGLWVEKHGDLIDWPLMQRQLASVRAETFAATLLVVARDYLGMHISVPLCPEQAETDVLPLLKDMLDGGIYGSRDAARLHTASVTINAVRSDREGKKPSLRHTLFPGRDYLSKRYPFVRKAPVLIPAAWMMRLCRYLVESVHWRGNSAVDSVRMGKQRLELLRFYGILR